MLDAPLHIYVSDKYGIYLNADTQPISARATDCAAQCPSPCTVIFTFLCTRKLQGVVSITAAV